MIVLQLIDNSLRCVECLALYGEVLLLSVERSYAWMMEDSIPKICTILCGKLSKGIAMKLDLHSLRPIPSLTIAGMHKDDQFKEAGSSTNSPCKKSKKIPNLSSTTDPFDR